MYVYVYKQQGVRNGEMCELLVLDVGRGVIPGQQSYRISTYSFRCLFVVSQKIRKSLSGVGVRGNR